MLRMLKKVDLWPDSNRCHYTNADGNIIDEKYVSINLIFHGRFNKWMD